MRALIYDSYIELVEKITVDKHIDPEDYYYLGFHFAEEGEQMGRFGIRMLRHLVEAFPRNKISEQAQQKLRLHLGDEEEEEEVAESSKTEKAKKPAAKKKSAAKKEPAAKKKSAAKKKKSKKTSSRRVTIDVSASTSAARKARPAKKKPKGK